MKQNGISLITLALCLSALAQADSLIRPRPRPVLSPTANQILADIAIANKISTRGTQSDPCNGAPAQRSPATLELERSTIPGKRNKPLPISVIGKSTLDDLVTLYPDQLRETDAHFCRQRAHVMGDTLAKHGIETQKLVVYPNNRTWGADSIRPYQAKVRDKTGLVPNWNLHVVNIVKVKDALSGATELYVLDPAVSKRPLPMEQWRALFRTTDSKGRIIDSIGETQVFSRFNADERGWRTATSYDQDALDHAYQVMAGSDGPLLTH